MHQGTIGNWREGDVQAVTGHRELQLLAVAQEGYHRLARGDGLLQDYIGTLGERCL